MFGDIINGGKKREGNFSRKFASPSWRVSIYFSRKGGIEKPSIIRFGTAGIPSVLPDSWAEIRFGNCLQQQSPYFVSFEDGGEAIFTSIEHIFDH